MSITKKFLEAKVSRLNKVLGRPVEPYKMLDGGGVEANVGNISLDHNPIYGGYILREMTHGGGQSNFMRQSQRVSPKEIDNYLTGLLDGLSLIK